MKEIVITKYLQNFLKDLLKAQQRKSFLIVDNLRVHHSKVKEWVENKADKIQIFASILPRFKPDEYLNNDLKQNANKNNIPKDLESLKKNTNSYMQYAKDEKVKGFFRHKKACYAA